MSKGKKWLITGICLSVLSLLFVAGGFMGYHCLEKHIENHTNQWKKIEYVAFTKSTDENPVFIPLSVFEEKTIDYDYRWGDYNTYTYYNCIETKEEKRIYKIYEYALENSYPFIYIESRLVPAYKDLSDMLILLSMDSAVVDQNLNIEYFDEEYQITQQYLYRVMVKNFKCMKIHISDFNEDKTAKIEECEKKAEEILASLDIDSKSTEREKAEAIYHYIGKNIEYKEYEDYDYQAFLHDAMIKGSSNCDGYANTFSLLCNMAGIKCCEKKNNPQTEDIEGHTWNTVLLDGVWYNVDATYAPRYHKDLMKGIPFRFGFSDALQFDKHQYVGYAPECTESLLKPDYTFKNNSDKTIAQKVDKAIDKAEKDYVMLAFEDYDINKQEDMADDISYTIYRAFRYVVYEGSQCTLVFIFPE